ncbi:MAG: TRAP transporter small permease [Syntrophorhabdales bacterium]
MWSTLERRMCNSLLLVAEITLAFMLVFTLIDVLLRTAGKPIVGDYEIISFLGAVVIGFSLPYTSSLGGHVFVDFLLVKLPGRAKGMMEVATRVASIILFLWIGWNFVVMSLDLIKSKEVTPVFRLPFYPISMGLALCCVVQCLTFVSRIAKIVGGRHE